MDGARCALYEASLQSYSASVKLATWNVNSIRARIEVVADWLEREKPDVFCMQETKVEDADFPREEFSRLGYSLMTAGQKSYNGVAIASRYPIADVCVDLPGASDDGERRLMMATIGGIHIVNVYVPNGKGVGLPSFQYKLEWYSRLRALLESRATKSDPLLVCGDFNVAAEARDVYDPVRLAGQLHFHPDEHQALRHLQGFGLVDAYRLYHPEGGKFSWWDYRAGAVRLNRGLRIDYVMLSEGLVPRCTKAWMDAEPRKGPKPSDHIPVLVELADQT